jgi:hypothetical protein
MAQLDAARQRRRSMIGAVSGALLAMLQAGENGRDRIIELLLFESRHQHSMSGGIETDDRRGAARFQDRSLHHPVSAQCCSAFQGKKGNPAAAGFPAPGNLNQAALLVSGRRYQSTFRVRYIADASARKTSIEPINSE